MKSRKFKFTVEIETEWETTKEELTKWFATIGIIKKVKVK